MINNFNNIWEKFLANSEDVMKRKVLNIPGINKESSKKLVSLVAEVIHELKIDKWVSTIAISLKAEGGARAMELYIKELEFFNSYVESLEAGVTAECLDFSIIALANIIASLGKIIKLPLWLSKILHILSELLGILSFKVV